MLNTIDEIITKTRIELEKHPEEGYDILKDLVMLGEDTFEERASEYCRNQGWSEPS